MINERDTNINMLLEQNKLDYHLSIFLKSFFFCRYFSFRHIDLSNKKDEQIKSLQIKLTEYRNIELIYKGFSSNTCVFINIKYFFCLKVLQILLNQNYKK